MRLTLVTKAFLKSFVRTCPVPMVVVRESDGTIVHGNDLAQTVFRCAGSTLNGHSLLPYLARPKDLQKLIERVHHAGTASLHRLHVKRSDGSPYQVLVSACRVPERGSSLLLLALKPEPSRSPDNPQDLVMDLHDSILQSLYGIGCLLVVCESSQEIPSRLRDHIAQARKGLEGAREEMSNLLDGYIENRAVPFSLKTALVGMAAMLKRQGFKGFRLHLDPLPPALLGPQESRQLFLVAKEAMSNSLRHAKATSGSLLLAVNGKMIILEVRDNGVGFDASTVQAGNGLRNIQDRVQRLGGHLRILSASGKGTRVILTLDKSRPSRVVTTNIGPGPRRGG